MKYYTISPSPEIADYVRFYWVLENDASDMFPYTHRSLAEGCCEMIFHYKGRFQDLQPDGTLVSSLYTGVSGPSQKFSRYSINESFGIFGVYLYPFAIASLFGLPTSALTNSSPDLQTVLGQPGKDLEEQIIMADNNIVRVTILNDFILSKLRSGKLYQPPVIHAILDMIKRKGQVNIAELSSEYYLSARQFERNFKTWSGFAPKLYARITRFQAATGQYNCKRKSLTDIAYECGYYDQSHFIHEFKEFSGYHPKQYFSGNNEGTDWKDG